MADTDDADTQDWRRARLLTGFGADDIEAFAAASERRELEQGAVIFRRGATNAALFLICRGSVQVSRPVGSGRIDLARLQAGETFGEMSFLDGSPTSADLVVAEPCEVLVIDRDGLERLMVQRPEVVAQLWHNVAVELKGRLQRTNELIDHYFELNRALQQTRLD